ncbi:MotE family protein [Eubacterium oxidoreducens]|uniref:Flagellar motility protein MotE, a chaperone for MotC folding n=1 Tax=Eubacterium oxidoreducens TaxID=1732 RepID=A0A1G6AQ30_EUBOX|nr:hypothetical protein [Eubacterium oxidoreducens]SDB10520.1 hypothetical protein SAMN02910417_00837 [Eubacterium oxidoreducens]
MADENNNVDPKADKKAAKAAKKEEKKKAKEAKKAAKKNGEDVFDDEDEEGSSKIVVLFATIIIIVVWIAILALIIKADVGGFGTNVMTPILKDVPYVNKILPKSDTIDTGSVSAEEGTQYDTLEDALNRIKELEIELQDMTTTTEEYKAKIKEYKAEIARLKEFEENQKEFEELKLKFDEEVVFSENAPDIEEYKTYYESIDPTNAELIYKEVLEQQQADEDMENYVSMYSNMKASEAAEIFDTMTDNLELVAEILENMESDTSSAILGKMNADTAAKLTVLMNPQE